MTGGESHLNRFGLLRRPDGYRWEVAWNPYPIGALVFPEVDSD